MFAPSTLVALRGFVVEKDVVVVVVSMFPAESIRAITRGMVAVLEPETVAVPTGAA
jgi:hypothetical protein